MSNTYFKIEKEKTYKDFGDYPDYTNKMRLTLTAFAGGVDGVQLTVQTQSTMSNQSGTGFIILSDEDMLNIIEGFKERMSGKISATGAEQSEICPNRELRAE